MSKQASVDQLTSVILDALDVDIQLWVARSLQDLRATDAGARLADWAQGNPAAFEALLRVVSVLAQRLPANDSLVRETLRDHLSRLPVELHHAFRGPGSPSVSTDDDPSFYKAYAAAVEGLSAEEIREVVSLSRSRLREWIYSPPAIRPALLAKWRDEPRLGDQLRAIDEVLAERIDAFNTRLQRQMDPKSRAYRLWQVFWLAPFVLGALFLLLAWLFGWTPQ